MTRRFSLSLLAFSALLPALFTAAHSAYGCRAVAHNGVSVQTADEEAIIVWDAAHHREDFIRHAAFKTQARNFGFLVPTPTLPTLSEVDPNVFSQLDAISTAGMKGMTESRGRSLFPATAVRVLSSQRIGGYDAVTLSADNVSALTHWLASQGYASGPGFGTWIKPYVQAHWKITAFKIAKSNSASPTAYTPLVRMSFHTDVPFYPYRETADPLPVPPARSRSLAITLLSPQPLRGEWLTGHPGFLWPGRTKAVKPLTETEVQTLTRSLRLLPSQMPKRLCLTEFVDISSPRPGFADVAFRR